MSFYFSKSKYVSSCIRCTKYAWLDKYKPEEKAEVDDFTRSLFENGHKVGELAKEYLNADVDVTSFKENGNLDLSEMIRKTKEHLALGTKSIAEASFSFGGFFCSVDILVRNDDGSYDMFEVKSSTQNNPTKSEPLGVKEKYIIDASYQKYVLSNCGINVRKVYIVLLDKDYVRGDKFELDKYFVKCDVTLEVAVKQSEVANMLLEIGDVLADETEPVSILSKNCNGCDFFDYCHRDIVSPSPFDIYNLKFGDKCALYEQGVSFFDVPKMMSNLRPPAYLQVEYYNRPNDFYIDKPEVRDFFNSLTYPLYSLDFETYQAVIPEYEGIKTFEQVPFQYSLHVIKKVDADVSEGSDDIDEYSFLDISGADTRRAIAESLVKNIPYGACVVAYHESTERNIIARLASHCPDLADHLLSFVYRDPLTLFAKGYYYVSSMGKSLSLKSVAPALYPHDKDMNYHNLEGEVKNGVQAMNVYFKLKEFTKEEREKIELDLKKYCALDTFAVVKILKKLYEQSR